MAKETWADREMVILEAMREAEETGADVTAAAHAAIPDLREDLYVRTLWSLYDDRFIEALADRGANLILPTGLAPNGRRAVRQWPSGDWGDLFLHEIDRRLAEATDEQTKTRLQRIKGAVGDVGKGLHR